MVYFEPLRNPPVCPLGQQYQHVSCLASVECWYHSRSDTQLTTGLSIWTTCSQEYEQAVSSNLPKTQVHTDQKKKAHLQTQSLTAITCVTALLHTKPAAVSGLWPGCSWWIRMREDQKLPAELWHKAPLSSWHPTFLKVNKETHLLFGSNYSLKVLCKYS